jgi:predicted ribosome quality control (RQC) complex YloA/Tae2 family protein
VYNNYYFLRQLSAQLENILKGFTLVSCFSQNRDELIIEFNNSQQSFFIKASLHPQFSCLSFPDSFNRAKKNSIDLFPDTILRKVTGVRQYKNERSFSILLENHLQMIFKMHGSRSNILLVEEDTVRQIFRNHLGVDIEIDVHQLDREIDWSKEAFLAHLTDLSKLYFTFGKEVWEYLREKNFNEVSPEQKWMLIQEVIQQLSQSRFFILEKENRLLFSLLQFGNVVDQFSSPILAVNEFFNRFTVDTAFSSEKHSIVKQLQDQLSSAKSYIGKNKQKLIELEGDHHYQQWADLIMANLHRIKQGTERIEVENFYNENKQVEIPLKKDLSGQRNAEILYRKGKNQQIEIQKIREAIAKREKEIGQLEQSLHETENITELKELRKSTANVAVSSRKGKEEPLPFHEFEFKGYKIWVGKNAENNDKLTLKYSFKEDLWLHAKDVPGSHVIIKYQSGKVFPKDVIERAAELAAYNSKRKTDSLCPVAFTPKKFVRKRKGDPAGAVVVEREEVILVEPKLSI